MEVQSYRASNMMQLKHENKESLISKWDRHIKQTTFWNKINARKRRGGMDTLDYAASESLIRGQKVVKWTSYCAIKKGEKWMVEEMSNSGRGNVEWETEREKGKGKSGIERGEWRKWVMGEGRERWRETDEGEWRVKKKSEEKIKE